MRSANAVGLALALSILAWAGWIGARQEGLRPVDRGLARGSSPASIAKEDTIFYTGFEPGDTLGINVDYNGKSSPDRWHVTKRMLYQGTTTWMTAGADSYFCHIGDDSTGYSDGNEVGYQIQFDLSNYSQADLFYLSAMQAYDSGSVFDKFVVWGQYEGMGDNWFNLDPGEGYAWGGDWGASWYEPEDGVISLADLVGHSGVIIEFWFFSDSGQPTGFGVAIDEILVTGTLSTAVEETQGEVGLPQAFVLSDPYPNPFNASVSIRYEVPDVDMQLAIYNVRGQLVKTLIQGFVAAGDHVATWDGRDERGQAMHSGIYFCQLRSGESSLTRKMVLLR